MGSQGASRKFFLRFPSQHRSQRATQRHATRNPLGAFDRSPRIIFAEEIPIMTAKFFRWPTALLSLTVAISAGAGVSRAQYGQSAAPAQAPPTSQNAPPAKDSGKPQKVNKAEEAAYKAFFASQGGDPVMQIQLGEDFITKFPMSKYVPGVYGVLTTDYYTTGNTDKMFAAGAKALELDPDNVDVLALLAMAIPRRVKSNTPDGPQQLQKAEVYARHAIELIPNLPKPATVDDATFEKAKNDKLALCHSGLGLLAIDHSKFEDARSELTQAVQLAATPDPVDYYLLGNADAQASFLNGAVAAYGKCADSGPLVAACKARVDAVKKDIASGTKLSRD
jgi:tetratricopeptide (TPR) repeat protein